MLSNSGQDGYSKTLDFQHQIESGVHVFSVVQHP